MGRWCVSAVTRGQLALVQPPVWGLCHWQSLSGEDLFILSTNKTDISCHFHLLPLKNIEQKTFIFPALQRCLGFVEVWPLLVTDHILFDYLCQTWPMLMVTAAGCRDQPPVYVSSDQPWLYSSTLPWENGAFQFLSSLSWIWAFKIFLMLYVCCIVV